MNKLIGAVILGLVGGAANAGEYLPWSGNDVARFAAAQDGTPTHESQVLDTDGPNWKLFSDFLGQGETWVWTDASSEDVLFYNEDLNRTYRLANFSASVGTRWNHRFGACNTSATIGARGETVSTLAGSFANAIRLDFSSSCADAGIGSAWFAKGVGLVKWNEQSIAGPRETSLIEADIAGVRYGATNTADTNGLEIKASFPGPRVLANVTPSVPVQLELTNNGSTPIEMHFNSSQMFEITIHDAQGEQVNAWSATRRFIQMMQTVQIAPGATQVFGGEIDLISLQTNAPLEVGSYTLRIELRGHDTPAASAFTQGTPYAAEAPLYVDYRMTIGQ